LNALPLLLHWLAWKPGAGSSIITGKDEILGLGKRSFLSAELINLLNNNQVYFLYQARKASVQGTICTNWLDSRDLGLVGDLAMEWEHYRQNLIETGITLSNSQDELRWTGGDCTGLLTTKNVYNALSAELWKNIIGGVRRKLWTWECPLKTKLFTWLLIEDKLLTWNNLRKRGWQGPGLCLLCRGNEESIFHLFVECPFTSYIWENILAHYKLVGGWSGTTVRDCFELWAKRFYSHHTLLVFICWLIWKERNLAIFETKSPSMEKVILLSIVEWPVIVPRKLQKTIRHSIHIMPQHRIIGWFDGATQRNGEQSGAGGVIKLNDHIEYRWTLNCGGGTNTRVELMGAWVVLTLAQRLSITDIHVIGDSKIIIDWLNNIGSLQVITIECWKDRVRDLIKHFSVITFAHVYREENQEADTLSKKSLSERPGAIAYNQWNDGQEGPRIFIKMF
jgi:ribonuclease HI